MTAAPRSALAFCIVHVRPQSGRDVQFIAGQRADPMFVDRARARSPSAINSHLPGFAAPDKDNLSVAHHYLVRGCNYRILSDF